MISAISKIGNYNDVKGIIINTMRRILISLVSKSVKDYLMEMIIADISKYNDKSTKYCGMRSFLWATDRYRWKNDDCKELIEVPFEKIMIAVPVGYDNILKNIYGNYHVFVKGSSFHEGATFEPDIPFEEYCKKLI